MKANPQTASIRNVIGAAVLLIGMGWLLYTYQVLFGPLLISCILAYLLYPFVTWLSKRFRVERRRVVPYVYLIFLVLLIWGSIYLAPTITAQARQLTGELTGFPEQLKSLQRDLDLILGFSLPLDSMASELETDLAQVLQPERVFNVILNASTNIVWVILIIITSFHLLRDWERLREWLFGWSPENLEPDFRHLHQEIKVVWQTYLRGQLLIMSILGLASGLGAAAIGLPGALLLGFLAGALSFIPTLGPATSTAIAAIIAWTQGSSTLPLSNLSVTIIIVLIFQVIQLVEGFWLTPRVMGRRLNLHPGMILIAIIGTLFTLGTLMALIIVPLLGSIALIVQYARRKQAGLDPWPATETPQNAQESGLSID
ncbi:MAG: AI-2E family transporter [Anaerolineales bacterium]|nr:AI-2E family transporter [Anaerolineales bacterium]